MGLLIIHIAKGGLCNRLRALVSVKILADTMGRELKVIWYPSSGCNCQVDDLFESVPTIDINSIKSKINLHYDFPGSYTVKDIEAQNDRNKIIHIHTYAIIMPSTIEQTEYTSRSQTELKNLKPLSEIERRITINTEDLIGLHIRRGDHWRATRYSPLSLFEKIIDKYLEEDSGQKFFLCSDSSYVKTYLKKIYASNILFYENIAANRNTVKGMQTALIDFLTLSRTKLIYRSYASSFGKIASQVHGIPMVMLSNTNSPKHWHSNRGDVQVDRLLRWDEQEKRWKIKILKGKSPLQIIEALFAFFKCQYFCSKLYQIYISRYLKQVQIHPTMVK